MTAIEFTTPAEARMRVDLARAKVLEVELQRREGALVPREAAEAEIFRLVRSDRDSWLAWPSRAAPEVAIAVGCTEQAAYTVLDQLIRKHITELAELEIDLRDEEPAGTDTGEPRTEAGLRAGDVQLRSRKRISGA